MAKSILLRGVLVRGFLLDQDWLKSRDCTENSRPQSGWGRLKLPLWAGFLYSLSINLVSPEIVSSLSLGKSLENLVSSVSFLSLVSCAWALYGGNVSVWKKQVHKDHPCSRKVGSCQWGLDLGWESPATDLTCNSGHRHPLLCLIPSSFMSGGHPMAPSLRVGRRWSVQILSPGLRTLCLWTTGCLWEGPMAVISHSRKHSWRTTL